MGEFDKIMTGFDKITTLYDKMIVQYDERIEKWRNIQAKMKQGKKTTQQATSEKETIETKQSLEATKEDVNELTQAVVSVDKLQSESKENLSLIEEEESPPVKKTQQAVMDVGTVTSKLPVAVVLPAASQLESKPQNSEVTAAPDVEVLEAAASEFEPKQTKPLNSEVIVAPVLVVEEFVENSLDINYMMQATVQEMMTHQQLLHLLTRFFISRVPYKRRGDMKKEM
ncbi:hypothetical protein ISN45_Aa04g017170 [Arabidopsis thaliana x Arabidopsis arenosa]|uniref:Uncharacterized protein n=1 Tax=Arabidopsis thaliana x Arabidopsis arenosa TaxID=1240361 RepID=A0A8T2ABA2_9BRAS|nr:hypothetical protein ISN45_Aa04g017170 [Arabidopsis thaliana x Arabidopsis arenosa]